MDEEDAGQLKELVAAALEKRGVLAELRARVRAGVFLAVEDAAVGGDGGGEALAGAAGEAVRFCVCSRVENRCLRAGECGARARCALPGARSPRWRRFCHV